MAPYWVGRDHLDAKGRRQRQSFLSLSTHLPWICKAETWFQCARDSSYYLAIRHELCLIAFLLEITNFKREGFYFLWWSWNVLVLVSQSCVTLGDPMDCSLPDSSVHVILQAMTLEWVAILFSRGSSQPRDQTLVSCIAGGFFTIWATKGAGSAHIAMPLSQFVTPSPSPLCYLCLCLFSTHALKIGSSAPFL